MAQFSSDDPNTALQAELIRQQQIIAELQQQMEAILVTQRPVIPSTSPYVPKIALPDKFHGKRSEFNAFLGQLGLQFSNYPEHYASSMNRKKLFGSLLEGQAKQWFTANFMFNAEIIPGDWDTLTALNIYKATANASEGLAFFNEATSVPENWIPFRDIVLARKLPRKVFIQGNTFIESDGTVTFKEYPATMQGFIDSFVERSFVF